MYHTPSSSHVNRISWAMMHGMGRTQVEPRRLRAAAAWFTCAILQPLTAERCRTCRAVTSVRNEASPLVLRCHEHLLVLLRCIVPRQVLVHAAQLDALESPLVVPANIHSTVMSTKVPRPLHICLR